MRIKTTATFIILSFLVGIGCCKNNSDSTTANSKTNEQSNYQNLDETIYLVLEPSLWVDCEKNSTTSQACRQSRESVIGAGIKDWLKHFQESYRPKVVLVYFSADVPANAINRPIHVSMKSEGCIFEDKERHPACYFSGSDHPKIIFAESAAFTIPTAAHEFGHALGLNHPDNESTFSIMSPHGRGNTVLPIDMITLCALHNECPPHDETWCEGTFYDKCRCPSESFGESEAQRKAQKIVCE